MDDGRHQCVNRDNNSNYADESSMEIDIRLVCSVQCVIICGLAGGQGIHKT